MAACTVCPDTNAGCSKDGCTCPITFTSGPAGDYEIYWMSPAGDAGELLAAGSTWCASKDHGINGLGFLYCTCACCDTNTQNYCYDDDGNRIPGCVDCSNACGGYGCGSTCCYPGGGGGGGWQYDPSCGSFCVWRCLTQEAQGDGSVGIAGSNQEGEPAKCGAPIDNTKCQSCFYVHYIPASDIEEGECDGGGGLNITICGKPFTLSIFGMTCISGALLCPDPPPSTGP